MAAHGAGGGGGKRARLEGSSGDPADVPGGSGSTEEGLRRSGRLTNLPTKTYRENPGVFFPFSLHSSKCRGTTGSVDNMRAHLSRDPSYLHKRTILKPPGTLKMTNSSYDELRWYGELVSHMMTALENAAASGHLECVKFLVEAGAKIDMKTLLCAVRHSKPENIDNYVLVLKFLMEKDQCRSVGNIEYVNVLMAAALSNTHKNDKQILDILLEEYSCVNHLYFFKNPVIFSQFFEFGHPLPFAFKMFRIDVFAKLLLHGTSPNKIDIVFKSYTSNIRKHHISLPHMILRVFPSPALAVRALEVYRQFGGNMWAKGHGSSSDVELSVLLIDYVATNPRVFSKLESVVTQLEEMIRNPLSLQSLCRLAIKQAMGRHFWQLMDKLPLPDDLKNFLKFMELMSAAA